MGMRQSHVGLPILPQPCPQEQMGMCKQHDGKGILRKWVFAGVSTFTVQS